MTDTIRTTPAARPVTPHALLVAQIQDLVELAATGDAGPAVRAGLDRLASLAGGLDPYLERWTTPESPALAEVAARTRTRNWDGTAHLVPLEQEMLSGHVEGQLLKTLVHATRARSVLEIGMFTGYATLAMAEALPPDGRVVACEIDLDAAAFAEEGFAASPAGARIDVRVGPALDTLRTLGEDGASFDLVFLDADKAGYVAYLDDVLDRGLLAPHGLLCADNTLLQGEPWSDRPSAIGAAIHDFNRAVAEDPRVEQVIVPLRDGVTLIRRTR